MQKAFTYYDSCVDQETRDQLGGEPLKKLIHELGSWPITDKQWRAESWDFTEASIKIHRKVAIGSFFTLFTSPDRVNSSGYVLNVSAYDTGNTYLTSLPLVSVRRHGRVTQ